MYATVVKRKPRDPTATVTTPLYLRRETNAEATSPLVSHTDTMAVMARFEVTSSRHRR